MNALHTIFCESLPNTLSSVPIPDSFGGIFKLSAGEFVKLIVFSGVTGYVGYSIYNTSRGLVEKHILKTTNESLVNVSVKKDKDKVVDFMDIEDIDEKAVYCRCWRSSKFPYCDGSHTAHNNSTGDNVGPLIVKHRN